MIQETPNYTTYYTPYGYLEFDQNEVDSDKFTHAQIRPNPKIFSGGHINVSKYFT